MREKIINILQEQLSVDFLSVNDDSAKHQGHAGWQPGGETHFSVTIVSDDFENMTKIDRHKTIYRHLAELLAQQIHALALKTYTVKEWEKRNQ